MLLTCPQCRCGLQVPDGTTAKVRCPACKNIFSPSESPAPEPQEDEKEPRAKSAGRKADRDEDEPRAKKGSKGREDRGEKNRDFDPADEEEERKRKRKKRRSEAEEKLTPQERAERKAAFQRAAIGAKFIWISLILFVISMFFVLVYHFLLAFHAQATYLVILAGFFGTLNWLFAAAGVGLCLSGPPAPGKVGYGILAALAVAIHLMFLFVVVARGEDFSAGEAGDGGFHSRWGLIPTRLDATSFYLAVICYQGQQILTLKGTFPLSMATGVLEMLRTVFIMMLLSCMARAALDEELAYRCTRAAGIACGAPAALAVLILGLVAWFAETGGGDFCWCCITWVVLRVVETGVYAIIIGTVFSAYTAARDVDDAMEEPFQSLIPEL